MHFSKIHSQINSHQYKPKNWHTGSIISDSKDQIRPLSFSRTHPPSPEERQILRPIFPDYYQILISLKAA